MSNIARHNMIERQIRTWEVSDDDILSLYADDAMRRENFIVDTTLRRFAYADMALPIADGQRMLEPKLEARMLQALMPAKGEKILHVGCGSGYFAALLGRLATEAISVEIRPALAQAARKRLQQMSNVDVIAGDGAGGWPAMAPYDAIVFTASMPVLAAGLQAQLKDNGRILAAVGSAPVMTLRLLEKRNGEICKPYDILETNIDPLENAPHRAAFSF